MFTRLPVDNSHARGSHRDRDRFGVDTFSDDLGQVIAGVDPVVRRQAQLRFVEQNQIGPSAARSMKAKDRWRSAP